MISIYLILFLISIDGIIATNRSLIISLCSEESIPRTTSRQYYFYFSSSSLSSSSSFLPLLQLSYCEHQQTTSYSSSGFSILHSSPRLPLTDIQDKKHSSFFHHNAVLSAVDQSSSSSTRNTIILMSSANENQIRVNKTSNFISTTTVMTGFSNLSLLTTSLSTATQTGNQTFNTILLIGCIIAGILLIIMIYLIIKCCNRSEGTYKIDESNNFLGKSSGYNPEKNASTGKTSSLNSHHQKLVPTHEQKLANSKEWYV